MAGSWEILKRPSILCAILHTELTTVRWAFGLRELVFPGPHHVAGIAGMPFDHARNAACQQVINSDIDYLFFLDSDVVPPPDALLRLTARRLPVVSGVYCRRSPPHGLPVMQRNGDWVRNLPEKGKDPMIEVDVVGAGCLLIHRKVLEQVPPQRQGKPWFDWRVDLQGIFPPQDCKSEDFTWCDHIRKHGVKVMVDTSVRCLHIGSAQADLGSLSPLVT